MTAKSTAREGAGVVDLPVISSPEQVAAWLESMVGCTAPLSDGEDHNLAVAAKLIRQQAAAVQAQQGAWIPVSERLPSGYEHVLVVDSGAQRFIAYHQPHKGGTNGREAHTWWAVTDPDDRRLVEITLWQPLPKIQERIIP